MFTLFRSLVSAGLLVAAVASGVGLASPAHAEDSIGGGTVFTPGTVFPAVAGQDNAITTTMFVQNLGDRDAVIGLNANTPPGVTVAPAGDAEMTLKPGETKNYPFTISTSAETAPGTYPVIVELSQTNVTPKAGESIAYSPAINGKFSVLVVGEKGTVTVNAVNRDTGDPISGQLSLSYVDEGQVTVIESVSGSTITRDVIPGNYVASFEIPGVVQQQTTFTIAAGDVKTVNVEVSGVQFVIASAKPVQDSSGVVTSADLIAAVKNNLGDIKSPVTFNVDVALNGEPVETVKMASLPVLPAGNTEQHYSYRPASGFTPGTWSFTFSIVGEGFKVDADKPSEITVAGSDAASIAVTVMAVGGLALCALLSVILFAAGRRRRRRDQDDD